MTNPDDNALVEAVARVLARQAGWSDWWNYTDEALEVIDTIRQQEANNAGR